MAEQMNSSSTHAGRTLVVILCMHRSGSSLLANLLARFGMSLGPFELIGATEHNKHGHFEAMPFFRLDGELLGRIFGFSDDIPHSPEDLQRFCECEGRWTLQTHPVSDEQIARGSELVEQLIASGAVSGFKDPRVPLLWPFWQQVFDRFPGLRIVPVVLVRSPHEIAMSIFMRSKGLIDYGDALNVTAVHYKRLISILDTWQGQSALVRFDPRVFAEDLRRAVEVCDLTWQEGVFSEVYDADCKHHEPASVAHPVEALYRQLSRLEAAVNDPANLQCLMRDAVTRETMVRNRLNETRQEVQHLQKVEDQHLRDIETLVEQCRQADLEHHQQIDQLESKLARITGSRTWRWREYAFHTPPLKWLVNSPGASHRITKA